MKHAYHSCSFSRHVEKNWPGPPNSADLQTTSILLVFAHRFGGTGCFSMPGPHNLKSSCGGQTPVDMIKQLGTAKQTNHKCRHAGGGCSCKTAHQDFPLQAKRQTSAFDGFDPSPYLSEITSSQSLKVDHCCRPPPVTSPHCFKHLHILWCHGQIQDKLLACLGKFIPAKVRCHVPLGLGNFAPRLKFLAGSHHKRRRTHHCI